MTTVKALGSYLRELREERGLGIRQIERETGIPNAYLSLLENGNKAHLPPPEVLGKLAKLYEVSVEVLLEHAGYLQRPDEDEPYEVQVEKAFQHVLSDPQFKYGTRLKGKYDLAAKRFIIEMYEKATKRTLLKTTQ